MSADCADDISGNDAEGISSEYSDGETPSPRMPKRRRRDDHRHGVDSTLCESGGGATASVVQAVAALPLLQQSSTMDATASALSAIWDILTAAATASACTATATAAATGGSGVGACSEVVSAAGTAACIDTSSACIVYPVPAPVLPPLDCGLQSTLLPLIQGSEVGND